MEFSGKLQGWDIRYKLTPKPDRLNMALSASFSFVGQKDPSAAVSAEGWISNFTQETLLTYEKSSPTRVGMKTVGLQGEMEIKWSAFKFGDKSATGIPSLSIPAQVVTPFLVGGIIPVGLAIRSVIQVVPELSVDQASSGGLYNVKYRSDQGFEVKNVFPSSVGKLHDTDMSVSDKTGSAGFGPVGYAVGIEFPRVDISILGTEVMAFITLKTYGASLFTPGTTLTGDVPPCQKKSLTLSAVAGYKFGILGLTGMEGNQPIWKKSLEKFKDDKPCDLVGGRR